MNPKGSPFSFFGTMRHFRSFFFKKKFKKIFKFYFVPSRETVIFQSYRAWKAHFGCLESVFKAFHEYVLSIFRRLCASWALDIAPTLDVPVLFSFKRAPTWDVLVFFFVNSKRFSLWYFNMNMVCFPAHFSTGETCNTSSWRRVTSRTPRASPPLTTESGRWTGTAELWVMTWASGSWMLPRWSWPPRIGLKCPHANSVLSTLYKRQGTTHS